MTSENSELVMLRFNYDIEKLKHFIYAAEQSEQEAIEIIAELKAENTKLKEENEILQTSLEMIKNTEGQAHIIGMKLTKKLEKIKEIASKYSQREDYLLGGLYADLVDGLNEVLKDE